MPRPLKHPPPPEQLRTLLQASRAQGLPFDLAWRTAMDGARLPGRVVFPHLTSQRRWWRRVLVRQRRHWWAAYEGHHATALAHLPNVVALLTPDGSSPAGFASGARMARAPMDYVLTPQDRLQRRALAGRG